MNYYNEWDPQAAAWLRELIKAGLIPQGIVDERSITEVTPADLAGFTQCHFFAGIGGWSHALQLAGIPATVPLWTGSPPCQPFSVAGAQVGFDDPRHLAPTLLELIAQCRPPVVFGEQVSAAIGKHWLDFIFLDLEAEGYTCGAAVLPAASVGAPHKRDRLFFGAALDDATSTRHIRQAQDAKTDTRDETRLRLPGERCPGGCMADTDDAGSQGRGRVSERADKQPAGAAGVAGSLANAGSERQRQDRMPGKGYECVLAGREEAPTEDAGFCGDRGANPHNGFWSDADWLGCRDGKFRPVEAWTQQMVDGVSDSLGCGGDPSFRKAFEEVGFPLGTDIPARVARLRGYGNAIVPQCAAEFIVAFRESIEDLL